MCPSLRKCIHNWSFLLSQFLMVWKQCCPVDDTNFHGVHIQVIAANDWQWMDDVKDWREKVFSARQNWKDDLLLLVEWVDGVYEDLGEDDMEQSQTSQCVYHKCDNVNEFQQRGKNVKRVMICMICHWLEMWMSLHIWCMNVNWGQERVKNRRTNADVVIETIIHNLMQKVKQVRMRGE